MVADSRPATVRWIVALTRIRLVMSLIFIVAAIVFMSPTESESMESFRKGWVGATGYTLDEYGPEQAGEVAGAATVPAVLMGLMLYFVRRRKLKALRVTAVVSAVLAIGHLMVLIMSIVSIVLAFRESTRLYFGDLPPANRRVPMRA